jgi:acetyl-CoA carboxylase biotin carboxyl carrier protein
LDIQQIRELIELMIDKDVAEVQLEQHGVNVRIRRPEPAATSYVPMISPSYGAAVAAAGASEKPGAQAGAHVIRSPMVGTFYTGPEPGAEAFVQVGDRVVEGQTLCIIEAMKLMNEITSDVAGEVVAVLQDNGQPVEYGQDLFAIRTS